MNYNDLILELWNLIEEHVKPNKREEVCLSILKLFEEYEVDLETLDFDRESKCLQDALTSIVNKSVDEENEVDLFDGYE